MSEQTVLIVSRTRGGGRCRSCDAVITWARTHPGNKAIPFDGDPVALKTEHSPSGELLEYVPAADVHWRTCPQADSWRRK